MIQFNTKKILKNTRAKNILRKSKALKKQLIFTSTFRFPAIGILTLTRPIGLPPHAEKTADHR